jgi:hypothetical protein
VVENSAALLSVFLNNSTPGALEASSFTNKITQQFPGTPAPFPWAMAAGDYDGDGRADLACGVNESVVLYQNTGSHPFTTNSLIPSVRLYDSDLRGWKLTSGDIDGDGRPDLIAANLDDQNISIFVNTTPMPTNRPSISVLRRGDSTLTLRITSRAGGHFTLWSTSDLLIWSQFISLANPQGILDLDAIRPGPLPSNFFKVQESQ